MLNKICCDLKTSKKLKELGIEAETNEGGSKGRALYYEDLTLEKALKKL